MGQSGLHKLFLWVITLSYMLLIFYFSHLRSPLPVSIPSGVDKVLHFVEYAVLGTLLYISLRYSGYRHPFAIALLCSILYSLTDEIHQYFVPMRDASPFDLIADISGAFVAILTTDRMIVKTKILP